MKATDWIILWNSFIVINGGHGKLGDGIILSDSFMSPTEAGRRDQEQPEVVSWVPD